MDPSFWFLPLFDYGIFTNKRRILWRVSLWKVNKYNVYQLFRHRALDMSFRVREVNSVEN